MTLRGCSIIFAFAAIVRLLYVVSLPDIAGVLTAPDTPIYTLSAAMLAETGEFKTNETTYISERLPGYILYLAGFELAALGDIWVVASQVVIDSLTCVLIAWLGWTVRREIGLCAGILAAVNPNMVVHSSVILPDTLALFFLTLSLTFAARYFRTGELRDGVPSGLAYGLTTMVRPTTLYFTPVLCAALPLLVKRLRPRSRLWHLVWIALAAAIVLAPWPLRNMAVFDRPAMTSQSGTHAIFWVVPATLEFSHGIPATESQDRLSLEKDAAVEAFCADRAQDCPTIFELDDLQTEIAWREFTSLSIIDWAIAWVSGSAVNLGTSALFSSPQFWSADRTSFFETPGDNIVAKVFNYLTDERNRQVGPIIVAGLSLRAVLIGLIVAGLVRVAVKRDWPLDSALFLALFGLYILAITGPVIGVKYRLPLEPLFCLLAAEGMFGLRAVYKKTFG